MLMLSKSRKLTKSTIELGKYIGMQNWIKTRRANTEIILLHVVKKDVYQERGLGVDRTYLISN